MPERVRTIFEENGSGFARNSDKSSEARAKSHKQGLKRKRDDNNAHRGPFNGPGDNSKNPRSGKEEKGVGKGPQTVREVATNGSSTIVKHQKSKQIHPSLKQKSESLLKFRRTLPIWPHADFIRAHLNGSRDALILVGETGSGKSTQVPQFLVNEPWCKGCIAITQPRRVAATSLAKRVAEEMGTPLGSSSPASKVGYSVRFDTSTSPSTKIKFLTEGMLLQEMLRDPALQNYSAIIVDEVHERSVNVDLILGFLRKLIVNKSARNGKSLKVLVMSATADVNSLVEFFDAGYPRQASEVQDRKMNHSEANPGDVMSSKSDKALDSSLVKSEYVGSCYIPGRLFAVGVTYLSEPTQDFVESALKCIFQIHYKEPLPGDILVFLTGQDTVETLERLVNQYAAGMDPSVPHVRLTEDFSAYTDH
jgi:ATP-dependent RNA helicase DHR2